MEGGVNPVETSEIRRHVKESLEMPLSQASMLAETALAPKGSERAAPGHCPGRRHLGPTGSRELGRDPYW